MTKRIAYEKFELKHMFISTMVLVIISLKPLWWVLLLGASLLIALYILFIMFIFWRPTYYGYFGYIKLPGLIIWQCYYIALIIMSFALFYHSKGIINSDSVIVKDLITVIYFSIVTFTTLGYGDFRPTEQIRIFAALEAVLGYICLGLFIATVAVVLQKISSKDGDNK